ncbi:MAG TPA: hypothetical protein VGU43_01795 [Thermoplasmata archaeon]|nr:hypothetical protein [Thermoplasmata archaeon]
MQRTTPDLLPTPEPVEGYRSILEGSDPSTRFLLRDLFAPSRAPPLRSELAGPPFAGGVRLVVPAFVTRKGVYQVDERDVDVLQEYLRRALVPLYRYVGGAAGQAPKLEDEVERPSSRLLSNRFSDAMLRGWSESLGQRVPTTTALVVVAPPNVVHSDCDPSEGATAYHSVARHPYVYLPLTGTHLTVADGEGRFALALSHALAELLGDPNAEFTTPELCDGGPTPRAQTMANYFSTNGSYLGSGPAANPPTDVGFVVQGVPRSPLTPGRRSFGPALGYAPP